MTFRRRQRRRRVSPLLQLVLVAVVLAAVGLSVRGGVAGTDGPSGSGQAGGTAARIDRVVDGDTLIVSVDGARRRVRVLGIDTPETVKPGAAVQRCGPEASARAKAWGSAHPSVRLQPDAAAPDEDRFGRLLRYVVPADGSRDLSTVQVTAGLARVKAYGQDLRELPALERAEARARGASRGLWGGGCGG